MVALTVCIVIKLVIVGKSARARALKNRMHTLPVHLLPLSSEREQKNQLSEKSRNSHHLAIS